MTYYRPVSSAHSGTCIAIERDGEIVRIRRITQTDQASQPVLTISAATFAALMVVAAGLITCSGLFDVLPFKRDDLRVEQESNEFVFSTDTEETALRFTRLDIIGFMAECQRPANQFATLAVAA